MCPKCPFISLLLCSLPFKPSLQFGNCEAGMEEKIFGLCLVPLLLFSGKKGLLLRSAKGCGSNLIQPLESVSISLLEVSVEDWWKQLFAEDTRHGSVFWERFCEQYLGQIVPELQEMHVHTHSKESVSWHLPTSASRLKTPQAEIKGSKVGDTTLRRLKAWNTLQSIALVVKLVIPHRE